ncbi:putative secreted protein [Wickerhamomyces ciferrii]|uniref:Secreted protein n=1 Tax=Wickerhamomyces ciferrii (strain ATCC 14091 / BCRC 22168 / CBS 111 / JCM 3599 / NBRC 0793 / NRRL Y-1031 F-60-10) TaxID=1206466 RepID=K0KMN1_WICCF|nr:uncharacterized protein BN7_6133 [Wickerhamomyces ciferrii]CCH46540.1 putative secreted protein [Wickerhamomyces ciferrii]
MKLSSVFVQGLLLSGIMASPIADSKNSNDTVAVEGGSPGTKLCFDANKSVFCYGNNYEKCVSKLNASIRPGHGIPENAYNYCKFWCSKVKNIDDCRTNKKKFDYHPDFACGKANYC